ncbi:ABC transporter substrate-binding protein [Fusibacter ferrireducens]|uniref:ABC transporter substrate-binding protein n=1 Tax=Fusibacter ferrireducens TaxID=2785058 RepID=A0ABR9ZQI8_9FIRM|nr:ABC transporter substrate-binding protein [Fusibacter ferrireducens]MBF4692694.1 ABC transporter substrate-binding protein [Fusibacter ferrireducens]
MKNKKIIIILIAVALFVLIQYQYNKIKGKPLQIGFVSALSGPSADLGFSCRNALELYIDEVNSAGGINGRPIEIIVLDDQGNPEIALSLFKQLIEENINLIVGQVTSSSGVLSIPYINEQDALFISPLISSNDYRGVDDNFIALAPSASAQGVAIVNYIYSQKESGKIAIIYDYSNLIYSSAVFKGAIEELNKNSQFKFQLYPLNDSLEIPTIVDSISTFNPDDFIVITSVSDLILISNQIDKELGDLPVYSSMWGMAPEIISGYGENMANVYGVYAIDPNSTSPEFLKFKEAYSQKYKIEANFGAIYTYDAARLLIEAIKMTHSTNPDKIKTYIKTTQFFEGINIPYEITDTGDAIREMSIIYAKDGKTMDLK